MIEAREGGPLAAVRGAFAGLTDGQRWTVGLLVVITATFLAFGLRRSPTFLTPFAAGATPATPVAATSPPVGASSSGGTGGTVAPPPTRTPGAAPSTPAASDDAPSNPTPSTPSPEIVAVVNGEDDAEAASPFLAALPDVDVVDAEDAAVLLCSRQTASRLVIASHGLTPELRACVVDGGGILVSHDDRGSAGSAVSTALGATAALVEAGRVGQASSVVGLVVEPTFADDATAAAAALEEEGHRVVTAVVDGTELSMASAMLTFLRDGVDEVVLATAVSGQDDWFSLANTLRVPFAHIVADIGDAVSNESYSQAPTGLRAVTATRDPWSARATGETDGQRNCRERYEAASGSPAPTADALRTVQLWCQHVALAERILAADLDLPSALSAPIDSTVTSPLVSNTPTGFGPRDVAVLAWDQACACWNEAQAFAPRRGAS